MTQNLSVGSFAAGERLPTLPARIERDLRELALPTEIVVEGIKTFTRF
jgi:hypothetical protein